MLLSETQQLNELNLKTGIKHARRKLFGLSKSEEEMLNHRKSDLRTRRSNRSFASVMLYRAQQKLHNVLMDIAAYTDDASLTDFIHTNFTTMNSVEDILQKLYTLTIYSDKIDKADAEVIMQYCETAKNANTDSFGNLNSDIAHLCDGITYKFN